MLRASEPQQPATGSIHYLRECHDEPYRAVDDVARLSPDPGEARCVVYSGCLTRGVTRDYTNGIVHRTRLVLALRSQRSVRLVRRVRSTRRGPACPPRGRRWSVAELGVLAGRY